MARTWSAWAAALSVAGTVAMLACDDDTGRRAPAAAAGEEEAETDPATAGEIPPPFAGEATGGYITRPDAGGTQPAVIDPAQVERDARCCNVTLSIADSTGDETKHVVVGDTAPLNVSGGVNMTYADGRWSANVCLPLNARIRYMFQFDDRPSDAGADAADPLTTRDYRYSSEVPSESNGLVTMNVYAAVADCGDIDASTGTSR